MATNPQDEDGQSTTGPPAHDQPVRDDLIDPEEVDEEPVDEPTMDEEVGDLPTTEELPESQGDDVLEAEHLTEDATSRLRLSDEELEDEEAPWDSTNGW